MAYSDLTVTSAIDIMGVTFVAHVDVLITSVGSNETYSRQWGSWTPPSPPDWDIVAIRLEQDDPVRKFPLWKAEGKFFDALCLAPSIANDVAEAAFEECAELRYSRRKARV
jgi:hypothetical protein